MIEFKNAAGVETSGVDGGRAASISRKLKCISIKTLVVLLTFGMTFSTTPTQLWADGVEGIVEAVQEAGATDAGTSSDASASAGATDEGESAGETSSQVVTQEQTTSGNTQSANASTSSNASETLNGTNISDGAAQAASSEQGSVQQGNVSANSGADGEDAQSEANSISADAKNVSNAVAATASSSSVYLHHVSVASAKPETGRNPTSVTEVKVGTTLWAAATVGAVPGYSQGYAQESDGVSYQWQYTTSSSTKDADFKDIDGATSQSYTVADSIDGSSSVGMYFRVKASNSNGEVVSTYQRAATPPQVSIYGNVNPVGPVKATDNEDAKSIVALLGSYTPTFTYGTDTNANTVLAKKIAALGKTGASVKVKSAQATAEVTGAQFGVSAASGTDNGTITYFSCDLTSSDQSVDLAACGSVDLVYEITYNGTTAEYRASAVKVPLDTAKMKEYLQATSENAGPGYAAGDSADSITQNVSLPWYADSGKNIKVTWTTSNDSAIKPAESADGESAVTRGKKDVSVTLTAKYYYEQLGSGAEAPVDTKTYVVTVKADPEKAKAVSAVVSVVGIDDADTSTTWVSPDSYTINGGGTVADYSVKAFDAAGLTYAASGTDKNWYLSTIADPSDVSNTLGWDAATGKYWQLFVNGEAATEGAGQIKVAEGDKIVWCYSAYGDAAPTEKVAVRAYIMGQDASGAEQMWAAPRDVYVEKGATGAEVTIALCEAAGIKLGYQGSQYGFFLTSMTSPYDSSVTLDNSKWGTTGECWGLYFSRGGAAPAYSNVGASSLKVQDGDQIVWYYGKGKKTLSSELSATAQIIGQDASGRSQYWGSAQTVSFISGETAADLSVNAFKAAGIKAATSGSGAAWGIDSLVSPYDKSVVLKSSNVGATWKLFVNGELVTGPAGSYKIASDDKVVWCYTAGDTLPDPSALIVNPDAVRTDDAAEWSGFTNGGSTTLVNVPTPTDSASLLWKVNLKTDSDQWVSLGDPIIVGGYVYVTTNSQLIKIDSKGNVVARISKGGTTSYFSRPVYADGLIISANDNGSLYAFSAQTLECVWSTPALDAPATGGRYQANNTMTVANGCVYAEFVAGVSYSGTAKAGAMVCVDVATGKVKWTKTTVKSGDSTGEGYYWAGTAASGNDLVIGDEGGRVQLIDGATGDVKSSVSIGDNPIRATIVSAGTEDGKQVYLAVGRQPATLYKIVRDGDALSVVGSCEFGNTSTSTPAVANGKVYIGGNDSDYNGQFAVIDLATMKVESTYLTGKYAEVKASPLASVQGDDTYVYFTYNNTPGAVLRYSQKTGEVVEIYTPTGDDAQYCTASVIADSSGNLYYTNDSGTLFALKAAAGYKVTFDSQGGSAVPAANPVQGKPMVAPSDPVRGGYTFLGWYTDADGTAAWNFSDPVASDMTLYAKWQKNAEPDPDEPKKDDTKKDDIKKDDSGNSTKKDDAVPTPDNTSMGNAGSSSASASGDKAPSVKQLAALTGSGVNIALRSTSTASLSQALQDDASVRASLLGGFESSDATATESNEAAAAPLTASAPAEDNRELPIWPFVGIAIGVVALAIALLKRRKEVE